MECDRFYECVFKESRVMLEMVWLSVLEKGTVFGIKTYLP